MRKTLSLFSANLLYGITMVFVITLGSLVQSANLGWGLIATEVLLIALPTLLFLRRGRVPLKSGLRLNPISPLTGLLCVVLGMSMYLFVLVIEGIMAQLTGMQPVPIPTDLVPKTALDVALCALALAVFAPVCEEMLFRGAIQGAYEARKSAAFAITITALLFAFFHFRVSGLPALIPVAFALGYVAWLTGSLYASILLHFGVNGMSALQSVLVFATGKGLPFLSLWSGLVGLAATIAILLVLRRLYRGQPRTELASDVPPVPPAKASWLATYWPLLIGGALYVGVAIFTLAASLPAKIQPAESAVFGRPVLASPVTTRYQVANQGGQPVGEMSCTLSPQSASLRLECNRSIRAYEYRQGNSYYKDGNHEDALVAEWDAQTMALQSFAYDRNGQEGSRFKATVKDGQIACDDSTGPETAALDKGGLVEFEWAWHAALLKADAGQSFSMPFARLMMWDESKKKSAPVVKNELLTVGADETLALPQGAMPARRLTLAGGTAWYGRDDAQKGLPRPAKLDDGVLIYTIVEG